ncbi:C6 zinc finger domain-containing protein [Xylaria flabelliformis]|nr:C6 zinc finger domain-containing protein [Xylaria flabelliformis]
MMPRKGFEKVRSGCTTCKARKVKCDEARPECLRCRTSARICGGYRAPPPGSFSWNSLLQIRPSTIPCSAANNNAELRGLDFFRCIVAPALTNPLGNSFWKYTVCQLAIQEPATKYAVLAIGSLYEHFDLSSDDSSTSNEYRLAVHYYNKALRQVATSEHLDAEAVLRISILFICIEFLRGNAIAAIKHCRHGIHILDSIEQASPDTSAIIHHLSIFPFFFGATPSDFPAPRITKYASNHLHDLPRAVERLDCLMSESTRLVRAFDPYRLGIIDMAEVPCSLITTQHELGRDLDAWYTHFFTLIQNSKSNVENRGLLRILEMRWNVCKIWVHIASHQDETFCDTFRNGFERIIQLAREEAASISSPEPRKISFFKFEMGLSPLLHFVLLKCRFLQVRLEALGLLRALSCARESLWDSRWMYAISRRFIEREHGLELSPWLIGLGLDHKQLNHALPSDDKRIRDSWLDDEIQFHIDRDGSRIKKRRISFYSCGGVPGAVEIVRDWVYLSENY